MFDDRRRCCDGLVRHLEALGNLNGGDGHASRRNAVGKGVDTGQFAGHADSFVVFDGDNLVDQGGVQDLGHKPGAQTLELVGPGPVLRQHRTRSWLDGDHPEAGVARFQGFGDAGEGADRANAGDDGIDLAAGVDP
jgi:hypothetical protein